MKIWLVYSTWYRYLDVDCPVDEVKGVFSSREKAQEFAKIWNQTQTGVDYWVGDELELDYMDLPFGYNEKKGE